MNGGLSTEDRCSAAYPQRVSRPLKCAASQITRGFPIAARMSRE
jgi:hypothetical protein